MAIKVNSNFEYQLKEYGDMRQSFATVAEMAAFNTNLIPNGFITFCAEDNLNYQWLDINEVDPTLGKWRKFTPGSGGDVIDDTLDESAAKTYSINKIKELVKAAGGFVIVDALPDLEQQEEREKVELNKIYLVPSADGATGNEKDEYVCVVTATAEGDETWSWECLGSIDGASVTIVDDFIPNNPIGKVAAGVSLQGKDIVQVVMDMLSVDVATTIALTGTPSAAQLNEKGVSVITDVALSATITLGTGTIEDSTEIIFKKDGAELGRETYAAGNLTYTYTDTGANIAADTTYSVEVAYKMGEDTATATKSITYKFALPMYYGASTTAAIADVTALTKLLSTDSKQIVTYTADNAYLAFCVPDTMSVTSIKDPNNFENVDSWGHITQSVTIGSEPVVYKVYTTKTPVTCTNFKYTITLA